MRLVRSLAFAAAACLAPFASAQPAKVPRIGVLANTVPTEELVSGRSTHPAIVGLLEGLRERGWIPGRNVEMVWRSAEGRYERHADQAGELAATCDVIVVYGSSGLDAAMNATRTVPIVMAASYTSGPFKDESGAVRVASLGKPGGNVTGLTLVVGPEILTKRLQLLKMAAPNAKRLAILVHAGTTVGPRMRALLDAVSLEASLYPWGGAPERLDGVFAQIVRDRADAVLVDDQASIHLPAVQKVVNSLAERHRLPTMHVVLSTVDSGGLMAYGHDIDKLYRRAAFYLDRILRGAKPGDLPIEQPADFELRVNLKAAKAIGLTLPPSLLLQATRVIQ